MKTCIACRETKPLDEFWKHNQMRDGRASKCKPCARAYNRGWSRSSQNHLRRRYGITQDDYHRMLARQGGVCAICEKPCPTGQRLAVDHDHRTGDVRGLLCMNCNRAIGHLQDDPTLLVRAAEYLTQKRLDETG